MLRYIDNIPYSTTRRFTKTYFKRDPVHTYDRRHPVHTLLGLLLGRRNLANVGKLLQKEIRDEPMGAKDGRHDTPIMMIGTLHPNSLRKLGRQGCRNGRRRQRGHQSGHGCRRDGRCHDILANLGRLSLQRHGEACPRKRSKRGQRTLWCGTRASASVRVWKSNKNQQYAADRAQGEWCVGDV